MNSLDPSSRADTQIWGTHFLHAMNISDEIVTWQEHLGWKKADVGWVSTSMYKLRPLATIWETSALAVPANLLEATQELNRYQWEIHVNNLSWDHIIPVYWIPQYGYSRAIMYTAESIRSQLNKLWINKINWFIESKDIQAARARLDFTDKNNVPYTIVDYVNSKGDFLQEMSRIGVPTAYGKTVFTETDAHNAFQEMRDLGAKQIYVKLSRAASWQWVFCINANETDKLNEFLSLPQTIDQISTLGIRVDYGIEEIIDSPNIMIFVWRKAEDDRFISASSQLLAKRNPEDEKATVHKGNISWLDPILLEKIQSHSKDVANWMRSKWAYGIVGLDYVVTKDEKIFIMEANYRVNGWLAAAMKWHDLQSPFWAANGWVKVPKNITLNEYALHLQKNWIEYNHWTNSGVIILNPATSPAWTIQIAVLWKKREQILDIMQWVDVI